MKRKYAKQDTKVKKLQAGDTLHIWWVYRRAGFHTNIDTSNIVYMGTTVSTLTNKLALIID